MKSPTLTTQQRMLSAEFYATRAFLEDARCVERHWRTVTILGASRYRIIRKWYLPDTYVLVLI